MTAEEMIDRIEELCAKHNLTVRYWQLMKGWGGTREHLDFADVLPSDINIRGVCPRIPDSKWNCAFNSSYWVIPLSNLSDREFQDEFESEFNTRLLYHTFL